MELELFNKSIFKFLFFDQYLNNAKGNTSRIICQEFNFYMDKLRFSHNTNTNNHALQQFKVMFNGRTNYQKFVDIYLKSLEDTPYNHIMALMRQILVILLNICYMLDINHLNYSFFLYKNY